MPPRYPQRFKLANDAYQRTCQPSIWKSFIEQSKREREGANLVVSACSIDNSDLLLNRRLKFGSLAGVCTYQRVTWCQGINLTLLRSSATFLAYPGLVDFAQFLTIVSIGLSLCSILLGVNGVVDEKLTLLQHNVDCGRQGSVYQSPNFMHDSESEEEFEEIAVLLDRHFRVMLFSVQCFFLAVLASTAWAIYGAVHKTQPFTVRYLFFILAVACFLGILLAMLRWNRRLV